MSGAAVNRQPPPSASLGGGCKLVSLFLEAMTDVNLALMSQPLPSLTDTITMYQKQIPRSDSPWTKQRCACGFGDSARDPLVACLASYREYSQQLDLHSNLVR